MGRRPISKAKIREIERLRSEGLTSYKIAQKLEIPYSTVNGHVRAVENGLPSYTAYQAYLASQRGMSLQEYRRQNNRTNQGKLECQVLAQFINERLRELNHNKFWLARQTKISPATIGDYASGKSYPTNIKTLERIREVLDPQREYKGIEALLVKPNLI